MLITIVIIIDIRIKVIIIIKVIKVIKSIIKICINHMVILGFSSVTPCIKKNNNKTHLLL